MTSTTIGQRTPADRARDRSRAGLPVGSTGSDHETDHETDHSTDHRYDRPSDRDGYAESGTGTGRWARRGSVLALLVGTGVLYLWNLSASGYANTFYAAAAQAGSQSWKAFLFGSLDASNAITVDKPPASLWLMALSIRLFGLNSWSLLVPQALCGVATVWVIYAAVRRSAGHLPGLAAGAMLALTPVATLMFRFDNPDALLVLLLTLAGYVTLRASERASKGLLALAGVLVGFAFLTKMLQAFLILPVLVLVYLLVAPTTLRRRLGHLLLAFAAMIVSLGWWVAIVELVPASMRPYVGGSTDDSVLDLIFGYNGFGRILGQGGPSGGGGFGGAPGGGGGGFGGATGITRLFSGVSGGMVTWLVPAALTLAVLAVVLRGRAPRTDRQRAAVLLWAGSLVVTALTFSFMAGIYHDYYTVALAPLIAATVATAGAQLWRERQRWMARVGLAAGSALTAVWAFALLSEASSGATAQPYATLRWLVLIGGIAAAFGLLFAGRLPKLLAGAALALGFASALTGPASYAVQTAATPHQGSIVTAGPVSDRTGFGSQGAPGGQTGQGRFGGQGGFPPGSSQTGGQTATPTAPQGGTQAGTPGNGFGGGGSGQVGSQLLTLLRSSSDYTWAAASTGSQTAADYQLASGLPVMAIGGFNGGDPAPTLAQFQADVSAGKIHYYIAGGGMGGGGRGGDSTSGEIETWVSAHYTASTVDGVTVYDLTKPN